MKCKSKFQTNTRVLMQLHVRQDIIPRSVSQLPWLHCIERVKTSGEWLPYLTL